MRALSTVFVLLLDEIILAALVLFILWKLGIYLPLWALITLAAMLVVCSFGLYKVIMPAVNGEQVSGRQGMIGLHGRVVTPLTPEGVIKVRGELWKASSIDASISPEEEIIVVGLEGLRLFVRRKNDAERGEEAGKG
ncbi:MAG TPA: hypothetical protein G4O03_08975 [Dehalococcoidia bacterium]|jgi:membrane-bound ClpP family serine protease|nr:hypothetical protein [Dehalococcoidia bacterium]